jgi:hypothetical protein
LAPVFGGAALDGAALRPARGARVFFGFLPALLVEPTVEMAVLVDFRGAIASSSRQRVASAARSIGVRRGGRPVQTALARVLRARS